MNTDPEGVLICEHCGGEIEPARIELGLGLCYDCADELHDTFIPRALTISHSEGEDIQTEVIRVGFNDLSLPQRVDRSVETKKED